MNISEYRILFPSEFIKTEKLLDVNGNSAIIVEGMLHFDDTASHFAGSFNGDYARFRIADHRNLHKAYRLETVASHLERFRLSQYNFPHGMYKNAAKDEAHLQLRLKDFSFKEIRSWEAKVCARFIDAPTVEFPFALRLSGNDDATYTKFYPALEDAKHDIQLMLDMQPCNFTLHVKENGFVFTN